MLVLIGFMIVWNSGHTLADPVKLNMKQGLLMNQVSAFYVLITKSDNELCKNHSAQLSAGLRAFEPWALQMVDASSKLQSGILEGNLFEFGTFRQCLNVYHNSSPEALRGKYCTIRIAPDKKVLLKILKFRNISEKRFEKVSRFMSNTVLAFSVCVPDSCHWEEVLAHFSAIVYSLTEGINVTVTMDQGDCSSLADVDKSLTGTELSIILLLAFFPAAVLVTTTIDFLLHVDNDNIFLKIFSARGNSKRIFSRGSASDLDCVHGLRFLSSCYVVIGHRYFTQMYFPVINSLQILDWVLYIRSTAITGGTLCVDTFFMVSGMLVSIGFFQEVAKSGRMNWILFYLHRYVRITAPLAVVVLVYATLIHHLGSGPLWRDMLELLQRPCREYWWASLLHVQNYVHPYPLCISHTWYLTCDMQYYFLSPLLLVPLWKCPKIGYINYAFWYMLSVATGFYLAWINKFEGAVPLTNQFLSLKYFTHYYIAPHVRVATYIIGLGFGYYYTQIQHKNKQVIIPPMIAALFWILTTIIMSVTLVGGIVFNMEDHEYNQLESTSFISFSRSAWTLGIVWIVFACVNGYGGPVNWILSWHLFRVLGRISYSIFLLHMLVQFLTGAASKVPGYFSDFTTLYVAFSDLFVMVVIGFVFTLCFESPIIKLITLAAGRRKKIAPN